MFGRIGELLHGRAQSSYNDSNKLIDRMLHPGHPAHAQQTSMYVC
jgi:hypothetical protein